MVRAVTFDFWNTLFVEVADAIAVDRATILCESLLPLCGPMSADTVQDAIAYAWKVHRKQWRDGIHYATEDAARLVATALSLEDGSTVNHRITAALQYMYPADRLTPCERLEPLLDELSTRGVKLGIISDTGFTPGRVLWDRLRALDLTKYFAGASFSDEVKAVKPEKAIFRHSLAYLRTIAGDTVHVGDLWRNDVCGARDAGFLTVRYRRWNDDAPAGLEADFVSGSHSDTLDWLLSQ